MALGVMAVGRAAHADGVGLALFLNPSGAPLPTDVLSWYPRVALNPERAAAAEIAALKAGGTTPVAVVAPDVSSGRVRALAGQGYGGFFVRGLGDLGSAPAAAAVRAVGAAAPGTALFVDRTDLVTAGVPLTGVVTEGLFTSVGRDGKPGFADAAEIEARRARLAAVTSAGIPVTVVERAPSGSRSEARQIAAKVVALGVSPWVYDAGGLDGLAVGALEPVPRRVLALYDSGEDWLLAHADVHARLALPLEHLGYAVDYADVRAPLPAGDLSARYAGIVSWFDDDEMPRAPAYRAWLLAQIKRGVRVAFFGRLGFAADAVFLRALGVRADARALVPPVRVTHTDALSGLEAAPAPLHRDVPVWTTSGLTNHIQVTDAEGRTTVPVATGAWGGFALSPYVLEVGAGDRLRWIVDPFAFLVRALALPPLPAPDATTENGLRLLEVHIDGDGFASQAEIPGRPFAAQVIFDQFLRKYPLPTTVSVIEGELSAEGIYPKLTAKLEPLAKKIFALPSVEIGSHSFSHPFDWLRAAGDENALADVSESRDPVQLPVPNYTYDPNREVAGSVRYIDERLAPPGKRTKVFLWSGTALPGEDAARVAGSLHLASVNGTNSEDPGDAPTLAQVPSLGRMVGQDLQIYAPAHNENVFTDLWRGRYYGLRDVIAHYKFTESPRRLKPLCLYYHFYSGTKPASLAALHEVYGYLAAQPTRPLWASELYDKSAGFFTARLARRLDGAWLVRGMGALRTLRLDARLGWPDLDASSAVVGVKDTPAGRYVALSGAETMTVALSSAPPTGPYVDSANGEIVRFDRKGTRVTLHVRAHVPAVVTLGNCGAGVATGGARADRSAGVLRLSFATADTGEVRIDCK